MLACWLHNRKALSRGDRSDRLSGSIGRRRNKARKTIAEADFFGTVFDERKDEQGRLHDEVMERLLREIRGWRDEPSYVTGGTAVSASRRPPSLPETSSELGPAAVLVSVTFQTRTRRFCHWLPAIGVIAALSSSLAPSAGHSPSRIALVLLVLRAAAPTANDALDVVFQALNRTSESRSGSTSDKCSRACGPNSSAWRLFSRTSIDPLNGPAGAGGQSPIRGRHVSREGR